MIGSFDIQGHRGARGLIPENTMPAFQKALDLGVTTLELDTGISADHQVVVSHDPWMSSTICSQPNGEPVSPEQEQDLLLYQMTYEEVAAYDCGKRPHPDFPQQQSTAAIKPLLRDVISFSEGYAKERGRPLPFYNVETKSWSDKDGIYHPDPSTFVLLIWEIVEEFGVAERFILQSFDVRTLQFSKEMVFPMRLALLMSRRNRTRIGHFRNGLRELGFLPDIYSPHFKLVTKNVVAEAQDAGISVIPWTVNEAADMLKLRELGIDGLISDYPDIAMDLLS